jgi:hypothetical protein
VPPSCRSVRGKPAQDAQQKVCQMEPGPGFTAEGSPCPVPDGGPFQGPGILARAGPFALVAVAAEASAEIVISLVQSAPDAVIVRRVLLWGALGALLAVATHGLRDRIRRSQEATARGRGVADRRPGGWRQDSTTVSGQTAWARPSTRSARPACPALVTTSRPNHATRTTSTTTTPAHTVGRSPHGTSGPRRRAPAPGHPVTRLPLRRFRAPGRARAGPARLRGWLARGRR